MHAPTRRRHVRRMLAIALVLATVAGCTSGGEPEGDEPAAEPVAEDVEEPADEPADEPAAIGDGPVQDVWVYERLRTQGADGELVDVTADVVAALEDHVAEEPVELIDGVAFHPAPSLDAVLRDTETEVRDDLEVVAGLVSAPGGQRLQVVATPTGATSVDGDDRLWLDLSGVEGLETGAPLIADFTFGHAKPAADDREAGLDGLERLAQRMQQQRFFWFGRQGEDGPTPGLLTVFGTVPGPSGGASTVPDTEAASGTPQVVPATQRAQTRPRLRLVQTGGLAGGVPAKAKPTIEPVDDLSTCDDGPIDCLKEYFDSQEDGFGESLGDLFDDNMTPDPPPDDPPCFSCGGGSGEPHMETFDGLAYDFQAVGEFVLAEHEDLTVQMRTLPWGDGGRVSVIGAVALSDGEHRVSVRVGRDEPIWVDGEPLALEQAREGVELDGTSVRAHGGDLHVSTPAGPRVIVHHVSSTHNLDVLVDPGEPGAGGWAGLLGDGDGEAEGDLVTRDGEPLGEDRSPEMLYDDFGDSWRISDDTSLFDYAPGESTAAFTDRDYPREPLTIDDLPERDVAAARTICEQAGIVDPTRLEWCVFDYAVTGEMQFVEATRHFGGRLRAEAGAWAHVIEGADRTSGHALLTGAGQVLVPTGDRVTALDLETGEAAWSQQMRSGCAATGDGEQVGVLTLEGEEDPQQVLLGLDPATGEERSRTVLERLPACDEIAIAGTTALVRQHGTVRGVALEEGEEAFAADMGAVAGPVVADDGSAWVIAERDDEVRVARRIDPGDGSATAEVELGSARPAGPVVGGPDGVLLRLRDDHDEGRLVRVDAGGIVWEQAFPATLGEVEVDGLTTGELVAEHDVVALYVGSSEIATFDVDSGELVGTARPSSFNNNGSQLHVLDGAVVAGPFGGDHWVEALPWRGGLPLWTEPEPEGIESHDAKLLGPATPDGQVIVAAPADGGVVVAKVGPGS